MTSSDLAVWIQTVVIVVSFGLAYRQFIRWREEIVGGKQIDLAIEIGKAAMRVREGFIMIRTLAILTGLKNPKDNKDTAAAISQNLPIYINEPVEHLKKLTWEASIVFDANLDEEFQKITALVQEFGLAVFIVMENGPQYLNLDPLNRQAKLDDEKASQIVYRIAPDEFDKRVNAATQSFIDFAQKTVKQHKIPTKYDPSAEWRHP